MTLPWIEQQALARRQGHPTPNHLFGVMVREGNSGHDRTELWEWQYLKLMATILDQGSARQTRNGIRHSVFDPERITVDLSQEFPMLTTRPIGWDFTVAELLWFLSGSTITRHGGVRVKRLWAQWTAGCLRAKEEQPHAGLLDLDIDDIGMSYGIIWRGIGQRRRRRVEGEPHADQLLALLTSLKDDPTSTRHVVSLWDADAMHHQIRRGMLTTCHGSLIQCYVAEGGWLDMSVWQRSADVPVGLPYNIASYALLTHILALQCDLKPGLLRYHLGDAHIYDDQRALAMEHVTRHPEPAPSLILPEAAPLIKERGYEQLPYTEKMFRLEGYTSLDPIPYPVSA
jgi:thymidylate synthase